MGSTSQLKLKLTPARPAYRSLHGWALGTLVEYGVVTECDHHGHRRNRSDPDAWREAQAAALEAPYPGTSPEQAAAALADVLAGIGDSCPDCG